MQDTAIFARRWRVSHRRYMEEDMVSMAQVLTNGHAPHDVAPLSAQAAQSGRERFRIALSLLIFVLAVLLPVVAMAGG